MKIAITVQEANENASLDPHFGRCNYFCIVDTDSGKRTLVDNAAGMQAMHGAGLQAVQTLAGHGVETLITGQVGPKAENALRAAGITAWSMESGTVDDALIQLGKDALKKLV